MIANAWKRANPEKHREHNRQWQARNADKVAAYNARRREEYQARQREARQRICAECGEAFEGRPNKKTCSPDCRRRWKVRNDTRRQETKQ